MSAQTNPPTPNINSDSTTSVFSVGKVDLALYGSPVQIRSNRNVVRRTGSLARMTLDEHGTEEFQRTAKLVRSDARRESSFIKAMSEDFGEDNKFLGRSMKTDVRRGSSFLKVGDDCNEENLSSGRSPKDIRRGSSFIRTTDDSLEESRKAEVRRGSSLLKVFEDNNEESLSSGRSQTPIEVRRGSSFIRTTDDSLEDSSTSRRLDVRRGSSFIRMISEDINNDEMHSTGRLSSRRGSGLVKTMSEDLNDDNSSRRSSKADVRRGSSFARMISEENDPEEDPASGKSTERSDFSDKLRKSLDNSYRHSLESISEYKTQTFSSASLYPSNDYSSLSMESTVSELSTDVAMRSATESNIDTDRTYVNSSMSYLSWIESVNNSEYLANVTAQVSENENRYGEWNNFWTNYNSSRNEYFSSPYLCPSNSNEDLSMGSNGSTPRGYTDKSNTENVILTTDEVNEALRCTQRLMEILRGALNRAETDAGSKNDSDAKNNSARNECKENEAIDSKKEKTLLKTSSSSCIDAILNHTGVAEILKRVINKRRDVIMPPDESSGSRTTSEWSLSKKY